MIGGCVPLSDLMAARDATISALTGALRTVFPKGFRAKVSFVVDDGMVPRDKIVIELKARALD